MTGDMTVAKLLTLDDVKKVLAMLDEAKEDIVDVAVIYIDKEDKMHRISTPTPILQLIGLLDLAKLETMDDCFAEGDDDAL